MTKKIIVALFLCWISFSASAGLHERSQASRFKTMPVIKTESMQDFLASKNIDVELQNEIYLITLADGTRAVFKPVPVDDRGDAEAEVIAYKISKFLGFPRVPVTVMRKINGKTGSLQEYIESNVNLCDSKIYQKIMQNEKSDEVANLKLFYFIFGQWDSGHHNMIVRKEEGETKIYAIDNSGIRNHQHVRYGSLPFVRLYYNDNFNTNDWDLRFPFESVQVIKKPNRKNVLAVFHDKISPFNLEQMAKQDHPIYYIIYRNSLWIQHHTSDPDFILSHTNYYPEKTMAIIKKLTLQDLKKLYADAKGLDFLTPGYFKAILDRRDQVLLAYEQQKAQSL